MLKNNRSMDLVANAVNEASDHMSCTMDGEELAIDEKWLRKTIRDIARKAYWYGIHNANSKDLVDPVILEKEFKKVFGFKP